jgi:ADP-heptose:LPS heptosyltransferase
VLTTPVVRCLKTQVKEAEVHYLTKSKFAPILKSNTYIDKIHILKNSFHELKRELTAEGFDYIIDLHRNLRTQRVKSFLHRYSFTFNKLNVKKWLLVNFKINRLPDEHIVERYFETVIPFSVVNDNKGLDFFIHKTDEVELSLILPGIDNPYLLIVAGGGHFTKQIPAEKIIEIITALDFPVVLIGGPEDREKADEIEKQVSKKVFNLTGKLNINQSASLIRQSEIILTPDTGMMHIASAFKKNIFSVWGNTIPEFGMYPYMPGPGSEIFEVKNLKCRPCSKIGFKKCPKKHFHCMIKQDYVSLINKLNCSIAHLADNK